MKRTFRLLGFYSIPVILSLLLFTLLGTNVLMVGNPLKKPPVVNLWGITVEDLVDGETSQQFMDSIKASISRLRCDVTTRIIFDPNWDDGPSIPNPESYIDVTAQIKSVSKVMGLFLDSEDWIDPFDRDVLLNRLDAFMSESKIFEKVDIWEIGNESNGRWVHDGDYEQTQSDLDTLFKLAKSRISSSGKKTALTLYLYPCDSCVLEENPPHDPENYMMVTWATNFVNNYPDVVNNIDYVFISYYPLNFFDCDTLSTIRWYWDSQIDSLIKLFPNSLIGFGEVGWSDEYPATSSQKLEIVNNLSTYSPMYNPLNYPWIIGGFYWNYKTDCFDANYSFSNMPVWKAIDSVMGECPGSRNNSYKSSETSNKFSVKKSKDLTNYTYTLSENFPNPFNPVTKINYSISRDGFVTLTVYDILGKEVSTLVNGVKRAGNYSVDFNASNLSSGVYFYRLQSGTFSDIKKMILIK